MAGEPDDADGIFALHAGHGHGAVACHRQAAADGVSHQEQQFFGCAPFGYGAVLPDAAGAGLDFRETAAGVTERRDEAFEEIAKNQVRFGAADEEALGVAKGVLQHGVEGGAPGLPLLPAVLLQTGQALVEPCGDHVGQFGQDIQIFRSHGWPGFGIHDTEGAQRGATLAPHERSARIKTDVRRACHQRIVAETDVFARVGNDQRRGRGQNMSAESDGPATFGAFDAETGFVPLAIGIDQGNGRHRGFEQSGGEARQTVKFGFGRRVENFEFSQRFQTFGFVDGQLRAQKGSGHRFSKSPAMPEVFFPAPASSFQNQRPASRRSCQADSVAL